MKEVFFQSSKNEKTRSKGQKESFVAGVAGGRKVDRNEIMKRMVCRAWGAARLEVQIRIWRSWEMGAERGKVNNNGNRSVNIHLTFKWAKYFCLYIFKR